MELTVPDPVIEVRGVGKRFFLRPDQRPGSWLDATLRSAAGQLRGSGAWVTAVDGVDLTVRRGEILGVLGPNGAGKTTLIKILCGLLEPSTGGGTVLGFDLLRQHADIRANVSLVAPTADVGTDNNLSVRQNLDFWAFVYAIPPAERRARVDELLEVVDLADVQDAWPMHISAGMRQRLAIARSLLAGNPLIFLDEPTVKLDPRGRPAHPQLSGRAAFVVRRKHRADDARHVRSGRAVRSHRHPRAGPLDPVGHTGEPEAPRR